MAPADRLNGPIRPGGPDRGAGDHAGGQGRGGQRRGGGRVPGRRRAPYRLRLIFAGVLLLLLVEILVLVLVGQAIGPGWVLLLLVATALLGAVLVKRESGRAWHAIRGAVDTGRMPGRELADASLVLVGGLLLLLPGFISDLLGIFLVLPFTHGVSRRLLATVIGARVTVRAPGAFGTGRRSGAATGPASQDIIEGEIIDEDPPPGPGA